MMFLDVWFGPRGVDGGCLEAKAASCRSGLTPVLLGGFAHPSIHPSSC